MAEEKRDGPREQLQDFIECYRSEPCLWKTKSKEYHDRNKKNAAYNKLVEKYKAIDPNADRALVVKKINNLRTTYRKELNKMIKLYSSGAGTDKIYTPRLWYFELLSFLYEQEVPRPSVSNTDEDENEKQTSASIGSNSNERATPSPKDSDSDQDTPTMNTLLTTTYSDSDQDTATMHVPLTPNYSDNERRAPTRTRSDHAQATPNSGRRQSRTRKNTLIEDVLKSVNDHFKRPKQPDNRFEVFGKNVGMKLQELPKEQRIIAEKIINETLFLAEMGSLTMAHTVRKNDDFASTSFST